MESIFGMLSLCIFFLIILCIYLVLKYKNLNEDYDRKIDELKIVRKINASLRDDVDNSGENTNDLKRASQLFEEVKTVLIAYDKNGRSNPAQALENLRYALSRLAGK